MARDYLKKAAKTAMTDAGDVRETVQTILNDIEAGGDAAALKYAEKFDNYKGNVHPYGARDCGRRGQGKSETERRHRLCA